MPHALDQPDKQPERLSLTKAARLTGLPKTYLRELVESGRLSVYLVPEEGEVKQRVTQASLVDAGLLPPDDSGTGPELDLSELVALIREQSNRISVLEEQRFQLGAQLGAAVARIASLEERIESLPALEPGGEPPPEPAPATEAPAVALQNGAVHREPETLRAAALRAGGVGLHRSTALGMKAAREGVRLLGRARRRERA